MADDPAFLVYYKDILVSCAHWDADILGWYFRLLSHQADKPGGLPDDLESLATLAGVKFSQFDRFNECWKHTLQAKFESNDQGLLYNEKQDALLNGRRNYKEKQAKRGLIGSYIKKAKSTSKFTPHQLGLISQHLFLVVSPDFTKDENEGAYQRTLDAFIAIGNGNKNSSSLESAENLSADTPLPESVLKVIEMNQFTFTQESNTEFVKAQWKVFMTERTNDPPSRKLMFRTLEDYTSYFINWMRPKFPKNGRFEKTPGKVNGKSAGAAELAAKLREKLTARGSQNP